MSDDQGAPMTDPYQVMPPLTAEEYDALRASIAAGYDPAHPVVTDEDGNVLDGHHRQRICAELGITPPAVVLPGLTAGQKHEYAVRANLARRHLTSAQKRELIAAELERDPDRSDREIGRLVGADHKTVGSVRRGEIPHPQRGHALPVGEVKYVKSLHARQDRRDGEQVIQRYQRDVYELPPITVARGRVLVDGFYRWQAYKRQGIAEIRVEDLGNLTDFEILRESVRRNSRHGLQRTSQDDAYAERLIASEGITRGRPTVTTDHPTPAEEGARVERDLRLAELGLPAPKPRKSNGCCRGCGCTRDECAIEAGVECCHACSHINPLQSGY